MDGPTVDFPSLNLPWAVESIFSSKTGERTS